MSEAAISNADRREPQAGNLAPVGVVVVSYRSEATIAAALDALPVADLAAVVVVDNASGDASAALARRHGATVVENPTNVGFGAACNRALPLLGPAEYVLFLNPDAVIGEADLVALTQYLDANPRCAMVAPRLFRNGEPLTSAGSLATVRTEIRLVAPAPIARRICPRRFEPDYDATGPVGYVEGACFLARRNALAMVGGFDERFFLFYEELDLARRFAMLGFTADLCASASAEHLVAASRSTEPDRGHAHLVRSAELYLRKWHGRLAARLFVATHAVTRRRRARR